ncbi:MAG: endonuclease/exonuclease/phosphatase family protein [Verrucomicrobiaceae bacterium]|nr:endonuclease/exonuclease/phosphatase family protein [Verrucomicrobiaceae bacterium]
MERQPGTLRMVTWNVNWGVSFPDRVAAFLRASQADVICLQETNAEWEATLAQRLSDLYPFRVFRESEGRMGGGLAFLSRIRGREVSYIRSTTGWFDAWIMSFHHAGRLVPVLNVHLRPPVSESGSAVTGYVTTNDDREAEIIRFAKHLDPNQPNIVCGDFNESPRGLAVQWLEKRGMLNVLSQFDSRSPTWEWPTSILTLRRRMDHVMVQSHAWRCQNAQVVRIPASDHFPVVVDLALPGA